mgnify:CR=1 FL=1
MGTASLAMAMMDEGTASRDALEISDELDRLGAQLFVGSDLDASTVTMNALAERLEPSLALFADVVANPAFPPSDFERLQQQTMVGIQNEMTRPVTMGLRLLPGLLYPQGHAYDQPLTGSGTVALGPGGPTGTISTTGPVETSTSHHTSG